MISRENFNFSTTTKNVFKYPKLTFENRAEQLLTFPKNASKYPKKTQLSTLGNLEAYKCLPINIF